MTSLTLFFVVGVLVQLVPVQAEVIEIDTILQMGTTPGWSYECSSGYQRNLSNFQCGTLIPIRPEIPELEDEVGFWTGCGSECHLRYQLNPNDTGFSFRAYFKNAQMTIVKNDLVQETVNGDKWAIPDIDLEFTTSIELRLHQITRDSYVVLDKIFIERLSETTTTEPPETTTEESTSEETEPTSEGTSSTSDGTETTTEGSETTTEEIRSLSFGRKMRNSQRRPRMLLKKKKLE